MFPLLAIYSDWALLVFRIAVAVVLLAHGWPKLRGLKQTHKNFVGMGFRPGWLWGTIVPLVEVVGAAMLIAGLFVQLVGALLAVQFLVAFIWHLKQRDKFVGNSEASFFLFASGLVLATVGGGVWALDNIVRFLM